MSPVFPRIGVRRSKKTFHQVVRTSVRLICYSGEFCNKNCIVKTSETLIIWSTFCYNVGSKDKTRGTQTDCQTVVWFLWMYAKNIYIWIRLFTTNITIFKISVVFLTKSWTFWYIEWLPTWVVNFLNGVVFGPPCGELSIDSWSQQFDLYKNVCCAGAAAAA